MKRWWGIAASILLISYVLYVTGPEGVARALLRIPAEAIIVLMFLVGANFAVVSFRLQRLVAYFGHPSTFLDALRATVSGALAGFYLSQIGGAVVGRHIVLRTLGVSSATNTLIRYYELLIIVMVGGALCIAGGIAVYGQAYLAAVARALPLAEILVVIPAAFVLGFWWFGVPFERTVLSQAVTPQNSVRFSETLSITLAAQFLNLAAYVAALHYMGAQGDGLMLFGAAAMVSFAALVLPSIHGWGVRETAALHVFSALDVAPMDAVAISITIGLCYTGVVFLGGITLLRTTQIRNP